MRAARLPLEPLEALAAGGRPRHQSAGCGWCRERQSGRVCVTVGELAERLRVTPRTIHRWRHAGGVPVWLADELATSLDLHPLNVWPDWS